MNGNPTFGSDSKEQSDWALDPEQLSTALSEFGDLLFKSLAIYRKGMNDGNNAAILLSFEAIVASVNGLVKAIEPFKNSGFDEPITFLQSNLRDIRCGIVPPSFVVKSAKNSDGLETRKFKFSCALGVEYLMNSGKKRLEAAAKISRLFPTLGIGPNTVARWRDELIGSSADDLAMPFRFSLDGLANLGRALTDAEVENYCEQLSKYDLAKVNLRARQNRASGDKRKDKS